MMISKAKKFPLAGSRLRQDECSVVLRKGNKLMRGPHFCSTPLEPFLGHRVACGSPRRRSRPICASSRSTRSTCALCHFLESMRRLKRRLKRLSGTLGEFSQFPRGRWFSELAQFSTLTLRCLPQSLSFLGNRFGGQARWRRTIASKSNFRIRPRQSGQFPFPFRAFPNSFLAVPRRDHRGSRGN